MHRFALSVIAVLSVAVFSIPARADFIKDNQQITEYLRYTIDARYSYEYVDAENRPNKANSSTLRTRLGLHATASENLTGFIEFENTALLGPANFAHAGNKKSASYPTVNAPNNAEVNQLYVNYKALHETSIRAGRQVLTLDDRRFLDHSSSSQNGVTFDALHLTNNYLPYLKAQYMYIFRQIRNVGHQVAGSTYGLDTHMFNLNFKAYDNDGDTLNLVPYHYLIGIDETPAASNSTSGLRVKAMHKATDVKLGLLLDAATQSDHENNPNNYRHGYYRIEPSMKYAAFGLRAGYETFEGNGVTNFQIPLGGRHSFNGWADVIPLPPPNGLNDKYLILTYDVPQTGYSVLNDVQLIAGYNHFHSDNRKIEYGDEYDLGFIKKLNDNYSIGVEYSDYHAAAIGPDARKMWLYLAIKY